MIYLAISLVHYRLTTDRYHKRHSGIVAHSTFHFRSRFCAWHAILSGPLPYPWWSSAGLRDVNFLWRLFTWEYALENIVSPVPRFNVSNPVMERGSTQVSRIPTSRSQPDCVTGGDWLRKDGCGSVWTLHMCMCFFWCGCGSLILMWIWHVWRSEKHPIRTKSHQEPRIGTIKTSRVGQFVDQTATRPKEHIPDYA